MKYISSDYCFSLNSSDLYDPDLGLRLPRCHGGTMAMWKRSLDPYVKICSVKCSSFLPIILEIPGCPTTIHIALYMPTSGKDAEFVEALSLLKLFIEEMYDKFNNPIIFLRGDSNANVKNKSRYLLLKHFQEELDLLRINLGHKTYHHFMGNGESDSEIDVIMFSKTSLATEKLVNIFCKYEFPQIDSSHDIIVIFYKH